MVVVLLAAGCGNSAMWPLSNNVARIGQYSRTYRVASASMPDDGSIIITCKSFSEFRGDQHDKCSARCDKTRFVRFSAEVLARAVRDVQGIREKDPGHAWMHTWYDGEVILHFRSASEIYPADPKAPTATLDSLPQPCRNLTPLELLPLTYDRHGDLHDEATYHDRVGRAKYRLFYKRGDVVCWLLLDESLKQGPLDEPGSGLARALLIGPAVIGDAVMMPVTGANVGSASGP
ncbi:MAG: hypothetical protein PHU85_13555 [Phycisphaerae bacterium]|nr:hypothetical protein [Phycisphaerae bacterium]